MNQRDQLCQEKICGNLNGGTAGLTLFTAWTAPAVNDYFQGTFEIFNAGPATTASVTTTAGGTVNFLSIPPGSSISNVPAGTTGKFCINLYKRLFA